MNEGSRTKNSIKNIAMSVAVQIVTLAVSMLSRRIFGMVLGAEYLGLSGLITNVLSVLSITELGISSAITYNLYKPIAENDKDRVARIINFYKQLYIIIGCVVFVLGMVLMPFLKYILKLENPIDNVEFYYFLFLINSVLSYFFVYKTAVMNADQKGYKLQAVNIGLNVAKAFSQMAVLWFYKSYTFYLLVQILFCVAGNIISSTYAQKKYPFISKKVYLEKSEKKNILSHVKDIFSYQIGSVALNNTDNILISVIDNTKTVGLYSNYCVITQAISTFTSMVFTATQSSVGNFAVKSDEDGKYKMFKMLTFLSFWIYGFVSVGIYECMQPVIGLWMGSDYVMSGSLLAVVVINFYIAGILYPIWSYRNTIGLFRQTKNVMFFTAGLNIGLSILLGKFWGIIGILLATGISRILTTVWFEPFILFRDYFLKGKKELFAYYLKQIVYAAETTAIILVVHFANSFIAINNAFAEFLLKFFICCVLSNGLIALFHFKSNEFKNLMSVAMRTVKRKV